MARWCLAVSHARLVERFVIEGLVHLVMNRLIGNLFTVFFQLADSGVTRIAVGGFHLLVGRFRGRNLAVGARNIRNLIANLANHLSGLQAFLLLSLC